jgi:hypothetical protein
VCRQRRLQLCFSASSCCPVGPNERGVPGFMVPVNVRCRSEDSRSCASN